MADRPGDFVWYELLTPDPGAAAAFYGRVLGWTCHAYAGSVEGYSYFEAAGGGVAGVMQPPPDAAHLAPRWYGYVGVEDVDATVARLAAAGGRALMPPTDIEGVGRIAMLRDPQGNVFYVMRGTSGMESVSFRPDKAGHAAWNELVTTDQPAALRLYSDLFGWEPGEAMPIPGLEGGYRFLNHGGAMLGAAMARMGPDQPLGWKVYFRVEDIDGAAEAVRAGGGDIVQGPMEIPGGEFSLDARDPQGAPFGLVGPRLRPASDGSS